MIAAAALLNLSALLRVIVAVFMREAETGSVHGEKGTRRTTLPPLAESVCIVLAVLARANRGDGVQEAREFWPGQVVVVVHVEAVEELQSGS
jgi:hypothetical protein